MSLTLDMPSAVETKLIEKARAAGVDLPTYALQVLRADALTPTLEELLAPARARVQSAGLSDDQIAQAYEEQKHAARESRRGAPFEE